MKHPMGTITNYEFPCSHGVECKVILNFNETYIRFSLTCPKKMFIRFLLDFGRTMKILIIICMK